MNDRTGRTVARYTLTYGKGAKERVVPILLYLSKALMQSLRVTEHFLYLYPYRIAKQTKTEPSPARRDSPGPFNFPPARY